jgi:hypothetical protein
LPDDFIQFKEEVFTNVVSDETITEMFRNRKGNELIDITSVIAIKPTISELNGETAKGIVSEIFGKRQKEASVNLMEALKASVKE